MPLNIYIKTTLGQSLPRLQKCDTTTFERLIIQQCKDQTHMRTIRNGNRPFPLISPASPYLSYQGYVCTLASPQSRLRSPRCPRFMILPICLFFFLIYILLNFHSFLSLPNSNFCHVLRTSCTRNSRIPEADKVKSLPPIS